MFYFHFGASEVTKSVRNYHEDMKNVKMAINCSVLIEDGIGGALETEGHSTEIDFRYFEEHFLSVMLGLDDTKNYFSVEGIMAKFQKKFPWLYPQLPDFWKKFTFLLPHVTRTDCEPRVRLRKLNILRFQPCREGRTTSFKTLTFLSFCN